MAAGAFSSVAAAAAAAPSAPAPPTTSQSAATASSASAFTASLKKNQKLSFELEKLDEVILNNHPKCEPG
jgi:hypothetical protein